jgi:hypothetical protein
VVSEEKSCKSARCSPPEAAWILDEDDPILSMLVLTDVYGNRVELLICCGKQGRPGSVTTAAATMKGEKCHKNDKR